MAHNWSIWIRADVPAGTKPISLYAVHGKIEGGRADLDARLAGSRPLPDPKLLVSIFSQFGGIASVELLPWTSEAFDRGVVSSWVEAIYGSPDVAKIEWLESCGQFDHRIGDQPFSLQVPSVIRGPESPEQRWVHFAKSNYDSSAPVAVSYVRDAKAGMALWSPVPSPLQFKVWQRHLDGYCETQPARRRLATKVASSHQALAIASLGTAAGRAASAAFALEAQSVEELADSGRNLEERQDAAKSLRESLAKRTREISYFDESQSRLRTHKKMNLTILSSYVPDAGDDLINHDLDSVRQVLGEVLSHLRESTNGLNTLETRLDAERVKRIESLVRRVTVFLIVPTFIATIFGANIDAPGVWDEETSDGFFLMLALMALGSFVAWAALRRTEQSERRESKQSNKSR